MFRLIGNLDRYKGFVKRTSDNLVNTLMGISKVTLKHLPKIIM